MVWVLHMTIDVAFVHMADKAAEQGDLKKVCFLHVVPPQMCIRDRLGRIRRKLEHILRKFSEEA